MTCNVDPDRKEGNKTHIEPYNSGRQEDSRIYNGN